MSFSKLILASGSPRRRELLSEAGYVFDVVIPRPGAEPDSSHGTEVQRHVLQSARSKASDVVQQLLSSERKDSTDDYIILSADTVGECDGEVLGKPHDRADARRMLTLLNGREHRVVSGVCVLQATAAHIDSPEVIETACEFVETRLAMDAVSADAVEQYLESGLWKGKAGGFGYQDRHGWLHILEGSESNVVGLPLERVRALLGRLGCFPTHRAGP